jgi:hypothetical protein
MTSSSLSAMVVTRHRARYWTKVPLLSENAWGKVDDIAKSRPGVPYFLTKLIYRKIDMRARR